MVVSARNSAEAHWIVERSPVPVRLLITTARLPEMKGCELAESLRTCTPEMGVLYVCGTLSEIFEIADPQEVVSCVLPVPFGAEVLLHRVQAVLALGAGSERSKLMSSAG